MRSQCKIKLLVRDTCTLQALESAPPPKVERLHSDMARPFHNFAKEAEKLSPLSIMSEQTKVRLLPMSYDMPGKNRPASAAIHVCQLVFLTMSSLRSSCILSASETSALLHTGASKEYPEVKLAEDCEVFHGSVHLLCTVPPCYTAAEKADQEAQVSPPHLSATLPPFAHCASLTSRQLASNPLVCSGATHIAIAHCGCFDCSKHCCLPLLCMYGLAVLQRMQPLILLPPRCRYIGVPAQALKQGPHIPL